MNTLDQYDVRTILHSLALLDDNMTFLEGLFPSSRATARGSRELIQEIRCKILDAAITDVAVEPLGNGEVV